MFSQENTMIGYTAALYDEYMSKISLPEIERVREVKKKKNINIIESIVGAIIIVVALIFYFCNQYVGMTTIIVSFVGIIAFINNSSKLSFKKSNDNIECLIKVLKSNKLYSEKKINYIIKNTEYKSSKAIIITVITSLVGFIKILKTDINVNNIDTIIFIIISAAIVGIPIDWFVKMFPKGIYYKSRQMTNLLKIVLLSFKEDS